MSSIYLYDKWARKTTVLIARKIKLKQINWHDEGKISGKKRAFVSADNIENAERDELRYPTELLNSILQTTLRFDHPLHYSGN